MLERFKQFISQEKLILPGEQTLLAASAGVDSSVLCDLFLKAGWPFVLAHCNFQLRGTNSELDEFFVKKMAQQAGVPFVSIRFDTMDFAEENKLSIQEAARQLRYEWLEQVLQQTNCQHIATAHHLDDSIETVLFNFARGCGIRGLHGILPRNGRLIRPLLFASKKEILEFASREGILFREDLSNLEDKYTRNKIRLQAIPVFEKINPSFQKSAAATIGRLREVEHIFDFAIQTIREKVMQQEGSQWKIDTAQLLSYPAPSTVLYELLRPFGFNGEQVTQILQSIEDQPGKLFQSDGWHLLFDRFFLVLKSRENVGGGQIITAIPASPIILSDGSRLSFSLKNGPPATFPQDPDSAWLDFDQLTFPLSLRHWQPGDVFQPIGLGGHRQKLQDFFSDRKLSRFDKEKVWLLESDGAIAWVVGMRLDERFKVSSQTKRCLVVHFQSDIFAKPTTQSNPSS